jgi:DNA-binding response OmpR family regulator
MLAGVSILVLEDDRDTSELFAEALRKQGGAVRTAVTVEAAFDILAAWRPDAILCDLHLPDVDGYAFVARLRTIAACRMVPVIAISASHPAVERERALDVGFAEYLEKPTRISEVVAVVTRVIARK